MRYSLLLTTPTAMPTLPRLRRFRPLLLRLRRRGAVPVELRLRRRRSRTTTRRRMRPPLLLW
jgi:hypothetical protein